MMDSKELPAPGGASPSDNPRHLSPRRNQIAATALLIVAIATITLAVVVL
jgi:hypothetical protein